MSAITFNIYLVRKASESEVEKALDGSTSVGLEGLEEGLFRTVPGEENTPDWYSALQPFLGVVDGQTIVPKSQSAGALMSCRVDGRRFLISFGVAHTRVNKKLVEAHFGRKVAMNAVPPSQVLELQSRQVFAAFHRLNERAPGATRSKNFAVEGDRDLVAAVEGITSGASALGRRVRGGTALSIDVEPKLLSKALSEALLLFGQPNRFAEWSEYDNLIPVVDVAEIHALDDVLNSYLLGKPNDLILAAPGDDDVSTATSFFIGRTKPKQNPVLQPLLYPASFYGASDGGPSLATAKSTPVHFYDSSQSKLKEVTTVHECICFETSIGQRSFVLWSGRWYEAQLDFVKRVRGQVAQLALPKNTLVKWNKKDNEDLYNVVAGKAAGFKTLDRKLVYVGGGQSKFEHCDVFHKQSQTLYFVKQYSASSTMSHLVEQVRRTSELFFSRDPVYRAKMKKAGLDVPSSQPRHHEWTLCLVVMGRAITKLPLFAQCGLARLARDLERVQHQIAAQSV